MIGYARVCTICQTIQSRHLRCEPPRDRSVNSARCLPSSFVQEHGPEPNPETTVSLGLLAGAGRIRTAGVARSLCQGKPRRLLENFLSSSANIVRRMNSPSVRHPARHEPRIPVSRECGWVARLPSDETQVVQGRWSKGQSGEHEPKTAAGQLPIIGSVGSGAVWSIPAGAARCVSALRR